MTVRPKLVALVTGSNRGLGFACAKALAALDMRVLISGRDPEAIDAAVSELRSEGYDVAAVIMDVTSEQTVKAAAQEVRERFGRLDVLVNNAGILLEPSGENDHDFMDLDALSRTFQVNLFGAVATIESFLPLLREAPAGRIVNVSSTMGSLADQSDPSSPYYGTLVPAYQASKAALNSITIGLSKLLASTAIKVTSVCPGWVQTDLAPGNRENAPTSAHVAATVIVRAATIGEDDPSGTFVDVAGRVAW